MGPSLRVSPALGLRRCRSRAVDSSYRLILLSALHTNGPTQWDASPKEIASQASSRRHRAAGIPPSKNTLCASRDSDERPTDTDPIILPMRGRATPLVIAFSLIAPDVQASAQCMTKQEARAKWPTKPIYSHGSSRRWNDKPLSSRSRLRRQQKRGIAPLRRARSTSPRLARRRQGPKSFSRR